MTITSTWRQRTRTFPSPLPPTPTSVSSPSTTATSLHHGKVGSTLPLPLVHSNIHLSLFCSLFLLLFFPSPSPSLLDVELLVGHDPEGVETWRIAGWGRVVATSPDQSLLVATRGKVCHLLLSFLSLSIFIFIFILIIYFCCGFCFLFLLIFLNFGCLFYITR